MSLLSWLRGPSGRPSRRPPRAHRPTQIRPRLERLEDRCLPSTVTNLNDAGAGSLRQAILDTPTGGTVDFQPGLTGTITLSTGELAIDKDLTIAGPGASVITVSGDHASRVFDIGGAAAVTVAIAGLTIADGNGVGGSRIAFGGGVYNAGTLTLRDSTLSGNSAGFGGGIANSGTLMVTSSTLSGNSAFNGGGGIYNTEFGTLTITASTLSGNSVRAPSQTGGGGGISNAGMLTITASTLSGNSATVVNGSILIPGAMAFGGGIENGGTLTVTDSTLCRNFARASALRGPSSSFGGGIASGGTLVVTNSTISGNSALSAGGGIDGGSMSIVTNSTISGNSTNDSGGGVSLSGGQVRNTLIAGNTAPNSPDVGGTINSQGHNLIGDGRGGSGYAATDLVGTSTNPIDPKLGPLQDNGGPTQTMALLVGSPAIDAGDNAFAPGPYDQRGPGFPRIVHGIIDIGAFEFQGAALTVQCAVATPVLWPPNGQLVNVGLSVQVSDPSATVRVKVYADGAAPADLAPGTLRLRADRRGGNGRVYLIVVTATTAAGTASDVCAVVVPHDQSDDSVAQALAAAADAEDYYRQFQAAPPGFALLGESLATGG